MQVKAVAAEEDTIMSDAHGQDELDSDSSVESSSSEAAHDANDEVKPVLREERKKALQVMFDSNEKENSSGDEEDDDDDDELVSQLMTTNDSSFQQGITIQNSSPSDPHVMRAYYAHILPFRYLFQWLNHSPRPCNDFGHREFAFTLPNEAYLRYQSFPTADLLRKQCIQMTPSRFEIGPVYSTNPRDRKQLRKASMFRPLAKELVFDIDLTDYDSIRTCCSGAVICNKCWTFITMAIKVIDVALRDDFGFNHILWVYSGRRGAHAWVCDKRARELDDQKRRAVATYTELLRGGDKSGKKINIRRPLHPHIERSIRILTEHFQNDVLTTQNPWQTDKQASRLLALLPDANLNAALSKKWACAPGRSSLNKWHDIDALASTTSLGDDKEGSSKPLNVHALRDAKVDVLLEYSYPRLDAEVSKKRNHLLKSPFCVHPGTGKVCVPIDVRTVERFDPLQVPGVIDLLGELEQWDTEERKKKKKEIFGDQQQEKKTADWEKTSLKPYVDYFRGFVANLLRDEKATSLKRERNGGDSMEI